ncbi:hypothetical protein [Deinococcus sp. 12RED42]|uniref:hypothetical protein n=1 Tax=Deinococcus sp. 12RED42 TaxID=2745872 RepID=UPI001E397447|nr:hypothetical protein [Deinococcus sp. 12RED42]MCD0164601.1 hypothetical protein [Deinococcus sp. 12RED42]
MTGLTPQQEANLARRCDQCWKPHRECQCVTFEGVHGHSYAGGGPAESQATWGDHAPDHRTWWGWALKNALDEAARLADVLPGSPAWQAWDRHARTLRDDLHDLGYDYPFAPAPQHPPEYKQIWLWAERGYYVQVLAADPVTLTGFIVFPNPAPEEMSGACNWERELLTYAYPDVKAFIDAVALNN